MARSYPISVHKFGGTSVSGLERIRAVVDVVLSQVDEARPVVVVSAMAGVTDQLVAAVQEASQFAPTEGVIQALWARHEKVAQALCIPDTERAVLLDRISEVLKRLERRLIELGGPRSDGARLRDDVLACGERMSVLLVAAAFREREVASKAIDASRFLETDDRHGDASPRGPSTADGIRSRLVPLLDVSCIPVVTGFCGRSPLGWTTTMGRGGSDLSATILGAALQVSAVSLWSDVPGVLTSDPRIVPEARPISHLNYGEAAELSFFGAKVLHPRTMAPVAELGIPVRCRSTIQPGANGTWIDGQSDTGFGPVKACSVIGQQRVITVQGRGMPGTPGVAAAVFSILAEHAVSVRMICQASSEISISVVVAEGDATRAQSALQSLMGPSLIHDYGIEEVTLGEPVSLVAIVGQGMRSTTGVASRLCGALSAKDISIIALAQGASEMSISVAIDSDRAVDAIRAVHTEFGLERHETGETDEAHLDLFLLGVGQIGRRLIKLVADRREEVRERFGLSPRFVGLVDRSGFVLRPIGLTEDELSAAIFLKVRGGALDSLGNGRQGSIGEAVEAALRFRLQNPVVVDVTDRPDNAETLRVALSAGADVVSANKAPLAQDLDDFEALTDGRIASLFRAEATVGAGLPVLDTLDILRSAGDSVERIEGCFSGTLGFVCDRLGAGQPFSDAVMEARELGYTEPDPAVDLSGLDVARKALILGRFAGWPHVPDAAGVHGLVPSEWAGLPIDEFRSRLIQLDGPFRDRCEQAASEGARLRYIARIDAQGIEVGLQAVPMTHPTAGLSGTDNMVVFTTARYHERPLVITGPGAGAEVTAMGVFADILRIAAERSGRRG